MRVELRYFAPISIIFSASILSIFMLLRKYLYLTLGHFLEVCRQAASTLLSSGAHYTGLLLSLIAALVILIFFSKAVFSHIKTKNKLKKLLKRRVFVLPSELERILTKNFIPKDSVIVIDSKKDLAFTANLSNTKIIISSGLIKKLTYRELEAVVLHESYHSKNSHPLLLIIGELLSSSLFFVPLLKDLTKKMRIVFEEESDKFTVDKQRSSRYLNLALRKITSQDKFSLYPSFSKRNSHQVKKSSVVVSSLVVFVGLALFLFPIQSQAVENKGDIATESCNSNQCSTDCLEENMSSQTLMSFVNFTY